MKGTVDFLRPRKTPWVGWVLLMAGLAATTASMFVEGQWADERVRHEQRVRNRAEAAHRARQESLRPVPLTPDQHRLQHISPQLRQPWLPTLRVVENATEPPVFLLGLAIDPAAGVVLLNGEAPTFDDALAYARRLDERDLLGPAQLRFHEQVTDPTGKPVVRFTLATRWKAQ